jgi:hypothetical protein
VRRGVWALVVFLAAVVGACGGDDSPIGRTCYVPGISYAGEERGLVYVLFLRPRRSQRVPRDRRSGRARRRGAVPRGCLLRLPLLGGYARAGVDRRRGDGVLAEVLRAGVVDGGVCASADGPSRGDRGEPQATGSEPHLGSAAEAVGERFSEALPAVPRSTSGGALGHGPWDLFRPAKVRGASRRGASRGRRGPPRRARPRRGRARRGASLRRAGGRPRRT